MKLVKLTEVDDSTRHNTFWWEGVAHTAGLPLSRPELCSPAVIHAYRTVGQALIMNEMHGCFKLPHIWEAEGDIVVDDGTKVGCRTLTTTRRLPPPAWWDDDTTLRRVLFLTAFLGCGVVVAHVESENGGAQLIIQRAALAALVTATVEGGDLGAVWATLPDRHLGRVHYLLEDVLSEVRGMVGGYADGLTYPVACLLRRVSQGVLHAEPDSNLPDDRQAIVGVIDAAIQAVTGPRPGGRGSTVKHLLRTQPGIAPRPGVGGPF
jgi:hypothetical protein